MDIGGKWVKSIKIAVFILAVCISGVGFAFAQVENGIDGTVVKTLPPPPEEDCPSDETCELWGEFKEEYGEPSKVEWDPEANAIRSVGGLSYSTAERVTTKEAVQQLSMRFIGETKSLWKVDVGDLQLLEAEYNKFNETFGRWVVNYQQLYRGIPVHKSYLGVSINTDGRLRSASSGIYYNISVPTTPEITKEQAVEIAEREIENDGRKISGTDDALKTATLVIFPEKKNGLMEYHLTWHSTPHPYSILVDAVSGEVVRTESSIKYSVPVETAQEESEHLGKYYIGIVAFMVIFALVLWRRRK